MIFTVVWDKDAEDELTRLWLDNPAVRQEISAAADVIDQLLSIRPLDLGVETAQHAPIC